MTASVFGATPLDEGLVEFRVWAPRANSVSVLGHELQPEGDGVFAGRVKARAGDLPFRFRAARYRMRKLFAVNPA